MKDAHVCDPAELFEEVSREEGEDGVLGGDHLVGGINVLFLHDPLPVLLHIVVVFWQVLVDVYLSWGLRRRRTLEE